MGNSLQLYIDKVNDFNSFIGLNAKKDSFIVKNESPLIYTYSEVISIVRELIKELKLKNI